MLAIGTNTGALMAQAAASSVNRDMETSMQRLSSGKRINAARDDAAGMAISSRLWSEIRGTQQSIRNSLDTQALVDTAEGGLVEVENILQRMRELAVQSSNGTNSATDRAALDEEYQALDNEISRILGSTTWAGQSLLDGTGGTNGIFNFQVGSSTDSANSLSHSFTSPLSYTIAQIAAPGVSASVSYRSDANGWHYQDIQLSGPLETGMRISYTLTAQSVGYGQQWPSNVTKLPAATGYFDIVADANGVLTGISSGYSTPNYMQQSGGAQYPPRGPIFKSASKIEFNMQYGGGYFTLTNVQVTKSATVATISTSDVTSSSTAQSAISTIDTTLQSVSAKRASLGALSNALDHTVSNLTNTYNNLAAGKGRIEDADFAVETTNLAKTQILQQASTAMLAQANAAKQNVLSLLQG